MAIRSPITQKWSNRVRNQTLLDNSKLKESLNSYHITEALKVVFKKNPELRDVFQIKEVKSKYNEDNPIFKIVMNCPKEDRLNLIMDLEEAILTSRRGEIIDAGFDIFKSGIVETGETTFFSNEGYGRFTQKPMLKPIEEIVELEPIEEIVEDYSTQDTSSFFRTGELCGDTSAYVPPLFFTKKEKSKGKQIESEIGEKPEFDGSPSTQDEQPSDETTYDIVAEADKEIADAAEGLEEPSPKKIKDKEVIDDAEKLEVSDDETIKYKRKMKQPSIASDSEHYDKSREHEDRKRLASDPVLAAVRKKDKPETIDYYVEEPEPIETKAPSFGPEYIFIRRGDEWIEHQPTPAKKREKLSYAGLEKREIEEIRKALEDDRDIKSIKVGNKKLLPAYGTNLGTVLVYHGKAPWGTKKIIRKEVNSIEKTEPTLEDAVLEVKNYFDDKFEGQVEEKKEKRKGVIYKTTAIIGAAAIVGTTLAGLYGLLAGLIPKIPDNGNGVTPDTNYAPTLSAISDQTVLAGNELYLEVLASDPNLGEGDVLTFSDDSPYLDITKVSANKGEIKWTPTLDDLGKHLTNITVKDKFGKSDTKAFNITVTDKPINNETNLPPELIDAYLNQLSKTDYELIVKARDQISDDYPGYEIEALLNGELLGSSTDSDLVQLLNITNEKFSIGDNQIDITVKDKHNVTKKVTDKLFLHKNIPPLVNMMVEKIVEEDRYILNIDANSFDDNLDKIQIFVDDQLYKEISPSTSQITLAEELDLTEHIGDKVIKVKATDKFGDSDEALETVTCQNDPTEMSTEFEEMSHEVWNYKITFDGIDNEIVEAKASFPELSLSQVHAPNVQNGEVTGSFDLTEVLPGIYNASFEATDDLDKKASEQYTVVVDNDGVTCVYNITNENDRVTAKIDTSDLDTKTTKLDVDFAGEHNITNPDSKVVHYEHTFDATNKEPGNAYVSASITDELGQKQELFNESVEIIDDLSFIENAEAGHNPIDDIIKVYNGAAKDDDTDLEDVLYTLRDSGSTVVKSGSLNPVDGGFDSKTEDFNGTIDTSGLLDDIYTLEITPRSNGADGTTFSTQIEINHTYEIVPVWNTDEDAANGDLTWNFTSGKADLLLEGNNTYFNNYLDEWNTVDSDLKNAVLENWSAVVNTNDPFATAINVQDKVRDIYGTAQGDFSGSAEYNKSREDFVACMEYIKNNSTVNWDDDFFVTNIAGHNGGVGDWRQDILYTYYGNNTVKKCFMYGMAPFDYSDAKTWYSLITEYNEYKTVTSQTQTNYEAKQTIDMWGRTNINWSNLDIDENTITQLVSWIDNPSGTNLDKLQSTLQTIDTYQKMNPTQDLKTRYDSDLGKCRFYNA